MVHGRTVSQMGGCGILSSSNAIGGAGDIGV